jgi:predicted Fe-Mo cluster-binding NifX family protein
VDASGQVGNGWGRAQSVAIAETDDAGHLVSWQTHSVGWDALHGQGTEGSHHARIVRFLRTWQVECVVAEHMGLGMRRVMQAMNIPVFVGDAGDARAAVASAAQLLADAARAA